VNICIYRVSQSKRGQWSFFRRTYYRILIIFGRWNDSSFMHFKKQKIKCLSQRALHKLMIFSTVAITISITRNFYIKTILLTYNFCGKNRAFASIYLLASIMYCNLFGGIGLAICFCWNNACCIFWTLEYNTTFFATGLSACIISDDRHGAL